MNKRVLLVFQILLIAVSPLFGQALTKIPRRVAFVQEDDDAVRDAAQQAITGGLADYLYTNIAARQPLVRVASRERARSTVLVVTRTRGELLLIEVKLVEDGRTREASEFRLEKDAANLEEYTGFIEETSAAFAPYLDPVEPVVRAAELGDEEELREVIRETDYADSLNKRFELTLWLSGLTRVYHDSLRDDPDVLENREFTVFPLIFDASYYLNRSFGLTFSFYFDYGDFFAFDTVDELEDPVDKAESTNVFLLPGLGISYRTLGLFSAQFSVLFYYGAVHVDAVDAVGAIGDAGASGWLSYSFLSLNSGLCWNFLPNVSLKTRFGINWDLRQIIFMDSGVLPYEMSYNGLFFNFFSVGVSYRL